MALQDMRGRLRGKVPKMPYAQTLTLVNDAWRDVRRQNLWSFLLWDDGWISPPLVNTGLATVVQGSKIVTFDSNGKNAINASAASAPYSPIINRQFRVAIGGIYNIWVWNPGTGVATLDRMYGEASGTFAFAVYQVYYPTPMKDFMTFLSIRNMQQFIRLNIDKNRTWLDKQDPQRTWYYFPTHAVPYKLNENTADTNYYQFPMFELWGAPQQNFNYQLYGLRNGVDLVLPTDMLPPAVGDDCVTTLAKVKAFEWAEANKGKYPELQKSDWRFLMGGAMKEYERLFKDYRRKDRELVNLWFSQRDASLYPKFWSYFNSIGATAFAGFNS